MDLFPKLISNENTVFATDSIKGTIKWSLESLGFNNPFEIVRTWWNLSPYQSNHNHNRGSPSKVQDTPYS